MDLNSLPVRHKAISEGMVVAIGIPSRTASSGTPFPIRRREGKPSDLLEIKRAKWE